MDVFTDHKSLQYTLIKRSLIQQKRSVELLKDYDMRVQYHLDKDNMVADSLSHMTIGSVSPVEEGKNDLVRYVHRLAR